jgi:hypothetical protein
LGWVESITHTHTHTRKHARTHAHTHAHTHTYTHWIEHCSLYFLKSSSLSRKVSQEGMVAAYLLMQESDSMDKIEEALVRTLVSYMLHDCNTSELYA